MKTLQEQKTEAILDIKKENDSLKEILRTLRDFPADSKECQEAWKQATELIKDK